MNPTAAHSIENSAGALRVVRATDPADVDAGVVAYFEEEAATGWTVRGQVTRSFNGLIIQRVEVQSETGGAGVTARMLRSVAVGNILSVVQAWLEASEEPGLRPSIGYDSATFERLQEPEQRGPGRAPLTPELLRQVAEGYLEETGPDKPRGAIKRIAERLGKPEPTISRWVVRARKDGWLGPATPGREGGEPGPRLFEARAAELEARLHQAAAELQPPADS